jgi:hypothetical protein
MVNQWKQKKTLKSSLFLTLQVTAKNKKQKQKTFEKNWRDCSGQQISNLS